jgi:putative oxidoreductase
MSYQNSVAPGSHVSALITRAIQELDRVPYALLALPLRLALATIFWNSGMTKLANWETTISLFANDYQVPLLPPEVAAYMAASTELTTPVLPCARLGKRLRDRQRQGRQRAPRAPDRAQQSLEWSC